MILTIIKRVIMFVPNKLTIMLTKLLICLKLLIKLLRIMDVTKVTETKLR